MPVMVMTMAAYDRNQPIQKPMTEPGTFRFVISMVVILALCCGGGAIVGAFLPAIYGEQMQSTSQRLIDLFGGGLLVLVGALGGLLSAKKFS